ncbi:hypothetical protein NQZ68_038687 [Dissostichus eleginoides]|nr:hypothetical protein NQZ68_038687 [Dissostichus eleginoides]
MDSIVSGDGSASGGLQEAGKGSTGIFIFPSSESGSGMLSGSGDLSGSGFSSAESGSSIDSSGESGQFSGMFSGFITGQDFSGFSGFPSGFSSGSASGHSGELSGSGDSQILLIDGQLIDASISTTKKEYELGGGLLAFSGSGDISGSGIISGDLSGSASGSGSGFFSSGVTFIGSGFTDLTVSSSGEQEASGLLLYSSGQGSGGHLSGFGSSSFILGSGSGMSGSESSTSGEESSVTFLSGDFTSEVSGDTTLSMELGDGSVEYSGEGSSSSSGLSSGSGDNHLSTASGSSSGSSSGDLPTVVPPSPSSNWALTESTIGPEEVHGLVEPTQIPVDVYGTPYSVLAPAGLAAPPTAASPTSAQTPGFVKGTDSLEEVDVCHPNPCANGATCVESADSYKCLCLPSYGGERCEIGMRSASAYN